MKHVGKLVTTKRADLNRILAKMNLQVDNPVCILNQETAKNFLHSSDEKQKYKLFERATQMDVMCRDFSIAEEELSRSRSCMKEKIQVGVALFCVFTKAIISNFFFLVFNFFASRTENLAKQEKLV